MKYWLFDCITSCVSAEGKGPREGADLGFGFSSSHHGCYCVILGQDLRHHSLHTYFLLSTARDLLWLETQCNSIIQLQSLLSSKPDSLWSPSLIPSFLSFLCSV